MKERTPFLVAVPLVLGSAFLLLVLVLLSRVMLKPSAWRAQADYYAQYKGGLVFVDGRQAALPGAFQPGMSAQAYSANGLQMGPDDEPLPYPPEDVWCVRLKPADAPGAPVQMVFVTQYSSLYQSQWLVHEAAGDPNATAAQIGCK